MIFWSGRQGSAAPLRVAVAPLGLATASPCRLVPAYGSGVLALA
jgi:hypothetical protein